MEPKKVTIELCENGDVTIETKNIKTKQQLFEMLAKLEYHAYIFSTKEDFL
jgi:hypothetical protein